MDPHGRRTEVTTVADDFAVIHEGAEVHRFDDLQPGTDYEFLGHAVRTLRRPGGELLSRYATVNDVHFGEVECGRIDEHPDGPIIRPAPGEPPYPVTMNEGAVAEISECGITMVIVKGDVTSDGTDEEIAAFERCYRDVFGDGLHVVRGNHDSYRLQTNFAGDQAVELPGLTVAVIDTVIPGKSTGQVSAATIEWLDGVAAASDTPLMVVGHHPQWVSGERSPDYFGINPDDSDALTGVIARRPSILAYAAGHTHRHRVRRLASGVPTIEVGCVKDFPGTWAEYRVFEDGVLQIVHRISTPAALAWSERCRHLYSDFGIDYATYALGSLEDRCFTIDKR